MIKRSSLAMFADDTKIWKEIACIDDEITTSNLSWSSHILAICRSAYMALNLLRRNVSEASTSIGIRKRLYLALVWSQLSNCSQLWRPKLMKDIVCLEKVQRRGSKYILGDRESDYRSRLITLKLLPLLNCKTSLQSPSDNFNFAIICNSAHHPQDHQGASCCTKRVAHLQQGIFTLIG